MEKKRVLGIVTVFLIGLFLISFAFAADAFDPTNAANAINNAAKTPPTPSKAGEEFYNGFVKFVDETPVVNVLFGLFFGMWEPEDLLKDVYDQGTTKIGSIVIFFVVWVLTFFIMKDILDIASPLSGLTSVLLAIGLTIVASQLFVVSWLAIRGATIAAFLGVASSWLLIIIFFVLFILALFGQTFLHKWIINLRMIKEAGKVHEGAGETKQAIEALREVQKSFKK